MLRACPMLACVLLLACGSGPALPAAIETVLTVVDRIAREHGAADGLEELPVVCEHEVSAGKLLVLCEVELPK